MEADINFFRLLNADISATEFEKFCLETLQVYAQREGLNNFKICHNQKVQGLDGTYQIDVLAEFVALGCKHIVVVECKKQSRNVERTVVSELYAKTQSIGAQKAILISTSGFQKGAVEYAEKHGVALWQICNAMIKHITASANPTISTQMMIQAPADRFLPKYIMLQWDCAADWPYEEIYPTKEMRREAMRKAADYYGVK